VKTDLDSEGGSREKLELAVGPEGLAAAMRIRDRLTGKAEGPRGLYLCHGFCELGATPLSDSLDRIHEFLVQNPNEVIVLVIEDYVSPADLAEAFVATGLDGLVYHGTVGPPWPTLRELIDSRQRVLVLTESGAPGIPWIHPAFEVMQETPYRFKLPSEMVCAPNRGGTSGSLFLMNNWIDTTPAPKPSNGRDRERLRRLLARAKACRGRAGQGAHGVRRRTSTVRVGSFRVARSLNGLAAGPTEASETQAR
jgi:hypothetical protein